MEMTSGHRGSIPAIIYPFSRNEIESEDDDSKLFQTATETSRDVSETLKTAARKNGLKRTLEKVECLEQDAKTHQIRLQDLRKDVEDQLQTIENQDVDYMDCN